MATTEVARIEAIVDVPPELHAALVDGVNAINRAMSSSEEHGHFSCHAIGCTAAPEIGRLCDFHADIKENG